ncbi:MAG: dihydroorotase family protein [Candidatus Cloacimonetes bacterium]|nr:dihydroorotase family protein [Candidatus Cloacimonadota bacterium]MCF7812889.1 dihydroorotase family protein [Candidatus Cloacimonadota bacterium]MCF7867101.1 dihydroorotase family protein [Candidatus Cloacimonadota bacterium]MCF7882579.1 dihydroorotase family protein [Candidatus Cloacimonadota bacterium]
MKTLLTNCRTPAGIRNILIEDELISYFGAENPEHDKMIDCSNLFVLPGMIDPHVHVRDMEMAYKETWETASKAAIAGGITTIMDMPNTKPATIDLKGLAAKRKAAKKSHINYKFHLGAASHNLEEMKEILKSNFDDVAGIKVFLAGSSSNVVVEDPAKLEEIFQLAKEFEKVVLVHSEMQSFLDKWQKKISDKTILNHNELRNREASIAGTKLVLKLAEEIGNKLYICHVSTKEEIELIRKAKQLNDNIFCEVTPHHLILNETILKQVDNFGKINPPLRTKEDNLALLVAIKDGTVDCLGTDHAPHSLEEKKQEYSNAPSGFPGLETAIPMTFWLVNKGHISLKRYSQLISGNAAEIFNIEKRGEIQVGNIADLIVIDPDKNWKIEAEKFQTKAKYSPFEGMKAGCEIKICFVGGKVKLPFEGEMFCTNYEFVQNRGVR